ncbi:uncharacterized protein LOC141857092 isoform X3 [Brevipalpus obovatus]|uniref:uncharacterized protein LOC141857092 isoform X3 n=1 Tax=Brevipalpus obovatus TaxID=246614 RepID=UPI003D9EBDC9
MSIQYPRKREYFTRRSPKRRTKMLISVIKIFQWIVVITMWDLVQGQDCFGGIQTFEKLAMTDFDDEFTPAGTLLQHPDQALTRDCINLCRQQPTCQSFGLDYTRFRCAAYSINSSGRRDNLVSTNTTNFFEKVCYLGVHRDEYQKICGVERLWAFERVKGAFLEGFVESVLSNIGSKDECAKSCLMEPSFTCRSADYDYDKRICQLSKEDRRTQPQAFRQVFGSSRDYLENQCAAPGPTTCLYDGKQNTAVITMDSLVFAQNIEDCEHRCDKEFTFNCRSYSMESKRCFLSGDDSVSLSNAALPIKIGSIYGEKKCVTEACTHGIFTYEKVTGHALRSALATSVPMSHTTSLGVTSDCREICDKANLDCPAFSISYPSSRCDKLDRNSQGRSGDFVAREGESFFEKICLRGPEIMTMCQDKLWAFERVIGYELTPLLYERVYHFVQSRRYCEEYCLQEKAFVCRSAVYNDETTECKLSREDRRTRPANYIRNQNSKISYLENQCIRAHSTCPYSSTPGAYPTYTDLVETRNIGSREDCENHCNDNRKFLCRSYAFYSSNNECLLSGDDRTSAGPAAMTQRPGMTYYERKCPRVPGDSITDRSNIESGNNNGSTETSSTDDEYRTSTTTESSIITPLDEPTHNIEPSTVPSTSTTYGNEHHSSSSFPESNGTVSTLEPGPTPGSTAFSPPPSSIASTIGSTATTSTTTGHSTSHPAGSSIKCGPNGKFTFERVPGFEPIGGFFSLLYSNKVDPGIITECSQRCEHNVACRAFVMDYTHHTCYGMYENSSIGRLDLRLSPGRDYFEGFCVSSHLTCSKVWTFDRIVDQATVGIQPKAIIRYLHKSDCRARCVEEKRFPCLSASYDGTLRECRLYDQDRNSGLLRLIFTKGTDYMENQCTADVSGCRYAPIERDIAIVSVTKSVRGSSTFFCENECNRQTDFNCRSYTYIDQSPVPNGNICLLSSDNRATSQKEAMRHHPRALYAEKDCRASRRGRVSSTPDTLDPPRPSESPTIPVSPSQPQPQPSLPLPPSPQPPTTILPSHHGSRRCGTFDFTYEKTYGYDLRFARRERSRIPPRLGITTQCQDECTRRGARCRAFALEYGHTQHCFLLEDSAGENRQALSKVPNIAYFEKICLKEKPCGKLWSFERIIGYDMEETPDKTIVNVDLRADCEDHCLSEKDFICRSATYDYTQKTCKLFTETQRSKPGSFKATSKEIDYLENHCVKEPSSCQYKDFTDAFFPYIDRISHAFSLPECQRQCDLEKLFMCRSLNYESYTRECALSSYDIASVGIGHQQLQARRHSLYSEKGNCEQVTVQCNQHDMMLTLNFDTPFMGRIYAKGNPTQCYELGTGQTHLKFSIPLNSKCGTRSEGTKNFVNEIVVQQHAVIMTDSDRTIKVMCSFSATDQTVTLSGGNQGKKGIDVTSLQNAKSRLERPIPSFVTNTAPPPVVLMRILDQSESDATLVGLGDELTMKIEMIDPTSAFAITARNLYAKSSSGESLFLIDSRGCPTDPSVFPALKIDPRDGKSLRATFKAFRFPSAGVVNFEVQIKFCPEKCPPLPCTIDKEPYGRRKRASLRNKTTSSIESENIFNTNNNNNGGGGDDGKQIGSGKSDNHNITESFLEIMNQRSPLHSATGEDFMVPMTNIQDFNYKISVQPTTSAPVLPAPLELTGYPNSNNTYSLTREYRTVDRANKLTPEPWYSPQSAPNYPVPYYDTSNGYGPYTGYGQSSNNHPHIATYNGHPSNPASSSSSSPSYHHHGTSSWHPGHSYSSYGGYSGNPYNGIPNYPHSHTYPHSSGSSDGADHHYNRNYTASSNHENHYFPATGGHSSSSGAGAFASGTNYFPRELPPPAQPSPSSSVNVYTNNVPPPLSMSNNNNNNNNKPDLLHHQPPSSSDSVDIHSSTTTVKPKSGGGNSSNRKKFRPPRPLPRPKGMPVRPIIVTGTSEISTEDPLSLAIVVGRGEEGEKVKSGEGIVKEWDIEKVSPESSMTTEPISIPCNIGPAILYTAVVITLVHCIVAACGYLYYRKYVYYMSGSKFFTFSDRSVSTENITNTITRNPRATNENVFFSTPSTSDRSLQSSSSIGNVGGFRSLYTGTLGSPP